MKKLILVPMKRDDRAEDFMPYVEEMARPGTKAVFMVPYPVDGLRLSHEEYGRKAIEEGMRLANYYKWDTHLSKAKALFAPVLAALSAKGIEAVVELYAGNMGRAIREYAVENDVHLIVSRMGIGRRIASFLRGAISIRSTLAKPFGSSVMLFRAGG